jgi:methylated-DNA-protein-cysteine methyltransferase-like protein
MCGGHTGSSMGLWYLAALADSGGSIDMDQVPRDLESQLYAWMAQIPAGRVVTYGQLAGLIGRPNGARWVGRQMRNLPNDSALPWYRVINARGCSSLPLDADGSNRQLRLLVSEGVQVVDGRIPLTRYRWDPLAG